MKCAFGDFQLDRYPLKSHNQLRAWDAADEYLLQYLSEHSLELSSPLIINDAFGALSVALARFDPINQSDSYIAQYSSHKNVQKNQLLDSSITYQSVLESHSRIYDWVIIKLPKTLALLEDELRRLRPFVNASTQIIGAGMVKYMHSSSLAYFEKILGPTTTSLAKKKARLIHCQFDSELNVSDTDFPTHYLLENTDYLIINHANVFCREKLDIGTRFLLEHLPHDKRYQRIVDLGCGNGVVGLMAGHLHQQAQVYFFDESQMAIESARATFHASTLENKVTFHQQDGLNDLEQKVDLILCNPPFHQQHVVGDEVAWRFFKQSFNALTHQGELWVIGNRHLAYHVKLKRLFKQVDRVATNAKFVVLKAVK